MAALRIATCVTGTYLPDGVSKERGRARLCCIAPREGREGFEMMLMMMVRRSFATCGERDGKEGRRGFSTW